MIFEENYFDVIYERENKYGLIPVSFFMFCDNIEIPLVNIKSFDVNQFKKNINYAISNIECIHYQYFANSDNWTLEFGTNPKEFTIDSIDYENIEKWCILDIYLRYNEKKNSIIIEFNKICGDIYAFYYIKKQFNNNLKNILFNKKNDSK